MRRVLAVAAVPAFAVVASGCISLKNGRLDSSSLVTITPDCQVVSEIAGGLTALLADAKEAGVVLRPETSAHLPPGEPVPPRIESCYRTYEMQEWWRNYYCSKGLCGYAAVPGTSRHGWGRAVDFEDEYEELSFDSPAYAWLVDNAASYGFHQPEWAQANGGAPEAWHWEA